MVRAGTLRVPDEDGTDQVFYEYGGGFVLVPRDKVDTSIVIMCEDGAGADAEILMATGAEFAEAYSDMPDVVGEVRPLVARLDPSEEFSKDVFDAGINLLMAAAGASDASLAIFRELLLVETVRGCTTVHAREINSREVTSEPT